MAAGADLLKVVRFQLLLLKEGRQKAPWEKSYVQWGLRLALLDSHAELIVFPNSLA